MRCGETIEKVFSPSASSLCSRVGSRSTLTYFILFPLFGQVWVLLVFGNIVERAWSFTVSKNFSTVFSYSGIPKCHVENPWLEIVKFGQAESWFHSEMMNLIISAWRRRILSTNCCKQVLSCFITYSVTLLVGNNNYWGSELSFRGNLTKSLQSRSVCEKALAYAQNGTSPVFIMGSCLELIVLEV